MSDKGYFIDWLNLTMMDECPYRGTEIIIGKSLTKICDIPGKDLCISQGYDINFEECSYYLFPEPLCVNYNKKECITCPCDKFEVLNNGQT